MIRAMKSGEASSAWQRVLRMAQLAAFFLAFAVANSEAQQSAPVQRLRIVGGLATVSQYTLQEEPFWSKDLARLSGVSVDACAAAVATLDKEGVLHLDRSHKWRLSGDLQSVRRS